LKKQSQFDGGIIGISSYLKGYYDKIRDSGARKTNPNKAKFEVHGSRFSG